MLKIKSEFIAASQFSDGLAPAAIKPDMIETKLGFIDKTGKWIIDANYEFVGLFQEGLAFVVVNGKYGFIDKTGTMVIEPQFGEAFGFIDGIAEVYIDGESLMGKRGYIDKTGKYIWEPTI